LVFYRPYAKSRLINALAKEIKEVIVPVLQTSKLKNAEMLIAKV